MVYIDRALKFSTPKNSYYNGIISNIEKLRESIIFNLEKINIKTNLAICTMESSSIITREFILPTIKKSEFYPMVKYEMKQYLPMVLNEYLLQYKILEETIENNVKKARILVSVLPKFMVQTYYELLSKLKLKPLALDMNSNAISKLFTQGLIINDEKFNFKKTAAVIDMGHSHMNINIISKGIPQFNRIIATDSRSIYYDLSPTKTISKIGNNIDDWIFKIQKVFQYYNSRTSGNRIDKIYFYGGRSKLSGLDIYFSNAFNIPSIKINTVNFINASKKSGISTLEDYLNGAGAIIRR